MNYQNYFFQSKRFKAGFALEAVWSTQDFFNNYIASTIIAPAFQPIAESKTYFMPQFRAHQYTSFGMVAIVPFSKNLEWRSEGYAFQPFGAIVRNELGQATYDLSGSMKYIAATSLIYHSPLGPVSLSANYYDKKEEPWSFLFNFGYILFNRSPRD
jgi:NTE family protein